ncbi:hypothetical protein [Phascolarctobacterium sp.]
MAISKIIKKCCAACTNCCETDDAEWNIAVTVMTARRHEPNFYNMEKACAKRRASEWNEDCRKTRESRMNGEKNMAGKNKGGKKVGKEIALAK